MLRLLSFVCLLSVVNCVNLGIFGFPSIGTTEEPDVLPQVVEVIRWRQPVCVIPAPGVPPCLLGLQQLQSEYDQISGHFLEDDLAPRARVKKTVETSEVREKINLDEIAPSSLTKSTIEIRDKSVDGATPSLDLNNENLEIRAKRYSGGISTYPSGLAMEEKPLPIYVTKVLNSPVTATLVADNCLPDIGVPLCEDYQEQEIVTGRHNKPAELPLEVPVLELKNKLSMYKLISNFFHKPSLTLNATSSAAVSNSDGVVTIDVETTANGDQNSEIPIAFTESNPTVAQLVTDDLSHKKEKIVEAIENKKEQITGAVASLAAMKQGIVQGIVDKKEHVAEAVTAVKQGFVQEIIHKKEQVSEAVTAVKQGIVQGIVDKKDKVIEAVTAVKQDIEQKIANKKEQVAEAVAGINAVKEGFVQGIVDKKHEAFQAIVNVATEKKAAIENIKHNAFQTAANIVARKHQIVQNMKDSVTQTAANIVGAKQHIVEEIEKKKHDAVDAVVDAATNLVTMKKGIVDGIVKKKHDAVEAVVDASTNVVTMKKGIVEGIVKKEHESFQDLFDKIRREHQIMRNLKIMVIKAIVDAADRKKQALLQAGQHVKDTALNATAKKHEMIDNLSRAIVHDIIDSAQKKKEAVTGIKQHTKDFVLEIATKKHQVIRELKTMIINAVAEVANKKNKAFTSIQEVISNVTAEKKLAAANAIEEKEMFFRKLLAKTHEVLQDILDAKINFELDVADKKQQLIQNITDSKVAIINSMTSKKQGIIKQIADKETDAIKKLSEKTQEFISTASLAKPLLISMIKQNFGSNQTRTEDDQENNNEGSGDDDFEFTTIADDLATEASPMVDDRLTETEEVSETTDTVPTADTETATDVPEMMSRKTGSAYIDEVESTDDSIPDMPEVMGEIFGDAFTYPEDKRPEFRMFQRFPPLYSMSPLPGSEKKQDSALGLLGIVQTVTNKKFASIAHKLDEINKRFEKILNTVGLSMQPPTTTNEPTTTPSSIASYVTNISTVKPSDTNTSTAPGISQLSALLGLLGLPAAAVGQQVIPALQAIAGLQALYNLLPTTLPTPIAHDPVDEDDEYVTPIVRPAVKPQVPWDGTLVMPAFDDSNSNQLQEHFDDINLDPATSAFINDTSLSEHVPFDPTPNESTQGETRMNTSANVNEVNNGTTVDDSKEPAIDIVYRLESESTTTTESSTVVPDNNKPEDEKSMEIVLSNAVVQEYSNIESLSNTEPSETQSLQDSIVITENPIYVDEEEEKEDESKPCVACQRSAQFAYSAKASQKNLTSEVKNTTL